MFYVYDGHIYLPEKDSITNKYPEVEVVVTGIDEHTVKDVHYALQAKGEGVSSKPSGRAVCGMEELIAKFGDEALEYYLLPTHTAPQAQEV